MNIDFLAELNMSAASKDKATFEKWEVGKISTLECMEQCFDNNFMLPETREKVSPRMFERWLGSLGWKPLFTHTK